MTPAGPPAHSRGIHVSFPPQGGLWHPEWEYAQNCDSVASSQYFGDACRAAAAAHRRAA